MNLYVSLFVLSRTSNFFVIITGDRAADLDLCLALTALAVRVLLRATPAIRDFCF
jgi:hypothetical protein